MLLSNSLISSSFLIVPPVVFLSLSSTSSSFSSLTTFHLIYSPYYRIYLSSLYMPASTMDTINMFILEAICFNCMTTTPLYWSLMFLHFTIVYQGAWLLFRVCLENWDFIVRMLMHQTPQFLASTLPR